MVKIEPNERSAIVYKLLELAKGNKLNKFQKEKLHDIVYNLTNRTEKQKEKFYRFYNLIEGEKPNYRLCDMARYYNCSSSNIRCAIGSIRNSLINLKDEGQMLILKTIVEECVN